MKDIVLWVIERIREKRELEEKESGFEVDELGDDAYKYEYNQNMDGETKEYIDDEYVVKPEDSEEQDVIVVTTENIFLNIKECH